MKRLCSMAILLAWSCMAWHGMAAVENELHQADRETIQSLRRAVAEISAIHKAGREKCDAELAELAGLHAELKELDARRTAFENLRASLQEWIDESREVVAAQRERWIVAARLVAVGEHYDSLTTVGGRQFSQVEITAVTDAGIEIRHASGTARIRCEYLGMNWWDRFQWSHDAQERLLASERQQAIRFGQAVAAQRRVALELERQRQEIAAAQSTQVAAHTSVDRPQYASPLRELPRAFGGGTIWRRYGWPRYGLYRYRYYGVGRFSNSCSQGRGAAAPVRSGIWYVGSGGPVPIGIPSSKPCPPPRPVKPPIVKPYILGR